MKQNNKATVLIPSDMVAFPFHKQLITFLSGETGPTMVNATEMAKAFGHNKRPQYWLHTQQAKEYISALSKARNLAFDNLVIVKRGAATNGGGTWLHSDLAIEFARWLSPEFSIWCNDIIKALMQRIDLGNGVILRMQQLARLEAEHPELLGEEDDEYVDAEEVETADMEAKIAELKAEIARSEADDKRRRYESQ